MNSITKMAVCALAVSGLSFASAETINFFEQGTMVKHMGSVTASKNEIKTKGQTFVTSKKVFEIDPAKKYSFKLKIAGDAQKPATVYIGFNLLDAKNQSAAAVAWQGIPRTFTQTTRAAKKGDSVLYVKNGSSWSLHKSVTPFVINAKQDGADLPNRSIINCTVKSKEKKGDEWVLTLNAPLPQDIEAGMSIRQHVAGGYYYMVPGKKILPGTEIELSGTVQGFVKEVSGFNGKNWPIGAKKAAFLMLLDWGRSNAELTIKEATFTVE